jgi:hypothetical protein
MQTELKQADTRTPQSPAEQCEPCEIPAFCRSNFYTGKLLTERDLTSEQKYFVDKMRLHYVALHGWGVVCGLTVRPHPECPDRFIVTEGFALDDCGREIRLLHDCVVHLPAHKAPPKDPCPPDPCDEQAPPKREPDQRTYYVCIRYQECQEEFMQVPFDECCGTTKKPNRVCEGYRIEVVEEAPSCLEHAHRHRHCGENDCQKLYETVSAKCPSVGESCCVPLAVIRYCDYEPLTEEMIDNAIRPVVPSNRLLEQLIHCVMEKLPKTGRMLTHIKYFNWEHDGEYRPHEFVQKLVGSREDPQGFEIHFDRRVHPRGLNTRTFQAVIVREPSEPHERRRVEVAPARVIRSEDGHRCTLHIDPDYARRHCHEHEFDLYITLKCDKVVDEHGQPVDGSLHARLLRDEDRDYLVTVPTGDGVPGGTFESWIRVRRAR